MRELPVKVSTPSNKLRALAESSAVLKLVSPLFRFPENQPWQADANGEISEDAQGVKATALAADAGEEKANTEIITAADEKLRMTAPNSY